MRVGILHATRNPRHDAPTTPRALTRSLVIRHTLLAVVCTVCLAPAMAAADLVPPGHKNVRHELVFEDSELFARHRIVAAPIAGFKGVARVEPGVPFSFSTKYGTRLYVLPEDVTEVEAFDRDAFAEWIHCLPPRSEMRTVVMTSPVARAETVLRLVSVDDTGLVIEEVSHSEFDASGRPVTGLRAFRAGIILIVLCGAVLSVTALFVMKRRAKRRGAIHGGPGAA